MIQPPFGGEEEKGIQGNFPEDKKTSETALLFLQLIMRKLKRIPKPGATAKIGQDNPYPAFWSSPDWPRHQVISVTENACHA